jgi:hypothetical protein
MCFIVVAALEDASTLICCLITLFFLILIVYLHHLRLRCQRKENITKNPSTRRLPPQKNRDSRPPTLRPSLLVTGQCIYMYVCVSCVIGEDEAIYLAGDSLYAE